MESVCLKTVLVLMCCALQGCGSPRNPRTPDAVRRRTDVVSIECSPRGTDTWTTIRKERWKEVFDLLARSQPFQPGPYRGPVQVPPFCYHLRVSFFDGQDVMLSFYVGDDLFDEDRSGVLYTLSREDGIRLRHLCGVFTNSDK